MIASFARLRKWRIVPPVAGLFLLSVSPALGQQLGQWWWMAQLGALGNNYNNSLGDRPASSFSNLSATLRFDVNGFIVHPLVGQFRLGLDTALTGVGGAQSIGSSRFGYRADVNMFPNGPYNLVLFARESHHEYADKDSPDQASTLASLIDTGRTLGGSFGASRGLIRGLRVGYRQLAFTFVDPERKEDDRENAFISYSRRLLGIQNNLRLERRFHSLGFSSSEYEDWVLNLSQSAQIAPTWNWGLNGTALRRQTGVGGRPTSDADTIRLHTRINHTTLDEDFLRLAYNASIADTQDRRSSLQAISVSYAWKVSRQWRLGPFARYGVQHQEESDRQLPQAGLSASWSWARPAFNITINTSLGYGMTLLRSEAVNADQGSLTLSTQFLFRHGNVNGLEKRFDVSVDRNDISDPGIVLEDLPDLGAALLIPGIRDSLRSRFTLRAVRRWGDLSGSLDHQLLDARDFSLNPADESEQNRGERWTAGLQFNRKTFSISASGGITNSELPGRQVQRVNFLGARASWRVRRYLRLWTGYRANLRDVEFSPNVSGNRFDAGGEFRMGLLAIRVNYFYVNDQVESLPSRRSSGFRWSISRLFAGWLPVVSAPQRRGVIR